MSAVTAESVSNDEFTVEELCNVVFKDEKPETISPPSFIASMLVNILSNDEKIQLRTKIREEAKNILLANGNKIPTFDDFAFVPTQEFMMDALERVKHLIKNLFPALENDTSKLFDNIGYEVDITEYVKTDKDKKDLEMINAILESCVYSLLTKIVETNEGKKYKAYKNILGSKYKWLEYNNFNAIFDEECEKHTKSIADESRGGMANVINFKEVINKAHDSAMSIDNRSYDMRYQTEKGTFDVLFYVNASYFHAPHTVKNVDGELVSLPKPGAEKTIKTRLSKARATGLFDDSKPTRIRYWKNEFLNDFLHTKSKNGFINLHFPQMLENLVETLVNELKKSYINNAKENGNEIDDFFMPHTIDMYKRIIERGLLGYYAWMNCKFYQFITITTNHMAGIFKSLNIRMTEDHAKCIMIPQIRNTIYSICGLYPILIPISMCKNFEKVLKLPISEFICKSNNLNYWCLNTYTRVLVTDLCKIENKHIGNVPCFENAVQGGAIIIWIYAETKEARQELMEKEGNVDIDGKRFKLLIYNPNADFKLTKYPFVRGCWFLLSCSEDDKWYFSVLTRNVFENIFGQKSVNTTIVFKASIDDTDTIVTLTHQTVPLPMTQGYKDEDSGYSLSNEYEELQKFYDDNPEYNNAEKVQSLIARLNGQKDPAKDDDCYFYNVYNAFQRFYNLIAEKCGNDDIPMFEEPTISANPNIQEDKDDTKFAVNHKKKLSISDLM